MLRSLLLRNLLLLGLTIVVGLGASFWLSSTPPPAPIAAQPAASSWPKAPDFTFTRADGVSGKLSDFAGKSVLLNFWASWCAPCRTEFPQFIVLAKARPDDVVILAISVDHNRGAMDAFLAEQDALPDNLIIAHDPLKSIAQDLFQSTRYPETILIGPDGTLRRKYVGLEVEWDSAEFIASLTP